MSHLTLVPGAPTDDTPHPFDRPPSKIIAPGVLLCTIDGTKMGNAIVIGEAPVPPAALEYLHATSQKLWSIETDFGNMAVLTTNEIFEFFTLGWQADHDQWWDNRLEQIREALEKAPQK